MNFLDERLPVKFWERCMPEPMSGCWLWTGATSVQGYGVMWNGRQDQALAYRVAYLALRGELPAPPLQLDHLCRTRGCVNPAHLEPVTQRENILRGASPSAIAATVTHCPKGHPYDERNTKIRPDGSRECRVCHRASCNDARARRRRESRIP